MFGKIFNNKENKGSNVEENSEQDKPLDEFERLILLYLYSNGIEISGNRSNPKTLDENVLKWIQLYLEFAGLDEKIEQVVLKEWNEKKLNDHDLTPISFKDAFVRDYHNLKIADFVPEDIQKRNKKLEEAYRVIITIIEKIQALEEQGAMKIRIESDFTKRSGIKSTMFQCTTRFCIVSLGCDPLGKYNIVYSIDHRILEMISGLNASILLRRIYQCTPGEMELFVYIHSLYDDCVGIFSKLYDEAKIEPYHEIISLIKDTNY